MFSTMRNMHEMMDKELDKFGVLEFLRYDKNMYVGGSLPAFVFSSIMVKDKPLVRNVRNVRIMEEEFDICDDFDKNPNDVDLYTCNVPSAQLSISNFFPQCIMLKKGVNLEFEVKDEKKVQLIAAPFKSFYEDILGNYDCSMVAIGYHPYTKQFIFHDRFQQDFHKKMFTMNVFFNTENSRIRKLEYRADYWFGAGVLLVHHEDADMQNYIGREEQVLASIQDFQSPPPYLQTYHCKFNCVGCSNQSRQLLCYDCEALLAEKFSSISYKASKKVFVTGGINGFGGNMSKVANDLGKKVYMSTRNVNISKMKNANNVFKYKLGSDKNQNSIHPEMMVTMLRSETVILNAYSTLDGDEDIWTTTLEVFSNELAMEKFKTNACGFAFFLQQFVKARKDQLNNRAFDEFTSPIKPIKLVFVDASESQYQTKLMDGKHVELNMAKAATKQLFYTNANLFASLGIYTICYDPGWLSYHGMNVEEHNADLIPQERSASALFYELEHCDPLKNIMEGKYIHDSSFYSVIKSIILHE